MKILIISHNPMSTKHSIGKTLLSLFSNFKKEELCQLYIHRGLPERDVCDSYYQVTDVDVLKGVIKRKVNGKRVEASLEQAPNDTQSEFYRLTYGSSSKRDPAKEILRDTMWSMSPWYNKSLKAWVDEMAPTCIFVAVGSGKFLYNMALKIAKDRGIPIVSYVCDDFYVMKPPRGFLGKRWKRSLEKKSKQLFGGSRMIISICDEIRDLYREEFGSDAMTIMTGTNFKVAELAMDKPTVSTIRYFGKVSLNRYQSLAAIASVVDEINAETGNDYRFDIYCGNVDDETKKVLSAYSCLSLYDFISGEEFKQTFMSSDALVHVEAFDDESIDRVKHSVSTKIADSLASGIPLIAYAPREVASMGHLVRNGCGITASDKQELKQKLMRFFSDASYRKEISEAQIRTAKQYHDSKVNSKQLYETLAQIG